MAGYVPLTVVGSHETVGESLKRFATCSLRFLVDAATMNAFTPRAPNLGEQGRSTQEHLVGVTLAAVAVEMPQAS